MDPSVRFLSDSFGGPGTDKYGLLQLIKIFACLICFQNCSRVSGCLNHMGDERRGKTMDFARFLQSGSRFKIDIKYAFPRSPQVKLEQEQIEVLAKELLLFRGRLDGFGEGVDIIPCYL